MICTAYDTSRNFYFEAFAESSCISMAEGPPLLRPKDISGMDGSMGEEQNVPAPTGIFIHSQNCNFPEQSRASF
jgi:hypothetical protein